MLIALLISLALIFGSRIIPDAKQWAVDLLLQIDFNQALLHGMLSFLLFAGALHVNINDLIQQYRVISGLATAGVIMSTLIIGGCTVSLVKSPIPNRPGTHFFRAFSKE